ncbi:MAG: 2-oxoglutarate dehydrogenase E1 component, partial [Armatimonadetes bacterium]|nr:2-oxoglutarate dehydrogenase E1 component [Armatimonadota bacterium]
MSEPGPNSLSLAFVEELYEQYLNDPEAVPPTWRGYFEQQVDGHSRAALRPSWSPPSLFNPPSNGHADGVEVADGGAALRQHRVDELIRSYRARGHMIAHLDPLQLPRPRPPELDPAYFGFTEEDMDRPFATATMEGPRYRTL